MPSNITTLNRSEIDKITNGDPKLTRGIESLFRQIANFLGFQASTASATQGLANTTFVTLSLNNETPNQRVLGVFAPLVIQDGGPGGNVSIGFAYNYSQTPGRALRWDLQGDTELTLPQSGRVLVDAGPFASDSAAAAGGVAVGQIYRKTDGTVVWRQV